MKGFGGTTAQQVERVGSEPRGCDACGVEGERVGGAHVIPWIEQRPRPRDTPCAGEVRAEAVGSKVGVEQVGLALGCGSARGWSHIGVVRALAELGLEPDVVAALDEVERFLRNQVFGEDGTLGAPPPEGAGPN